jgi:hypothetical protein
MSLWKRRFTNPRFMKTASIILFLFLFSQRVNSQDSPVRAIDQKIEFLKKRQGEFAAIQIHGDSFRQTVSSFGLTYVDDSLTHMLSEVRISQTNPNENETVYYFDSNRLVRADVKYSDRPIAMFYFINSRLIESTTGEKAMAKALLINASIHLAYYQYKTGN